MTSIPIFKVASVDFDTDLIELRKILDSFGKKSHFDNKCYVIFKKNSR